MSLKCVVKDGGWGSRGSKKYFIGGVRNLISTVSGPTINDLMMPNLVTRGFILSLGSGSVVVLFHVIDGRVLISSSQCDS